jgi:hypothetical protein
MTEKKKCSYIKGDGFRCTFKAKDEKEYCGRHDPAGAEERKAHSRKAVEARVGARVGNSKAVEREMREQRIREMTEEAPSEAVEARKRHSEAVEREMRDLRQKNEELEQRIVELEDERKETDKYSVLDLELRVQQLEDELRLLHIKKDL